MEFLKGSEPRLQHDNFKAVLAFYNRVMSLLLRKQIVLDGDWSVYVPQFANQAVELLKADSILLHQFKQWYGESEDGLIIALTKVLLRPRPQMKRDEWKFTTRTPENVANQILIEIVQALKSDTGEIPPNPYTEKR